MQKYKVTANVEWELELPTAEFNVAKIAKDTLKSILPLNFQIQVLKASIGQEPLHHLQILGVFELDEVFQNLSNSPVRVEFKVGPKSYFVKMNSQRYFVFQKNSSCVSCGLKATKFLLEQHPSDKSPHFNLYAEEGDELVLMTKDHIIAKSKGGLDHADNYMTTCSVCNNLKADFDLSYEQVRELRNLWNNSLKMTRKERSKLIDRARENMLVSKTENTKYSTVQSDGIMSTPC